jgi:putative type I restriction-modification system, M subunit
MVLKMTGMRMQKKTFFVPEEDRWSKISSAAHTPEIGTVVNDAMRAIDKENILIDIDTLNNKEFIKMLAYINNDKKY